MASFYDLLMQGVDYEAWVDYVEQIVSGARGRIRSVVDLACGTGSSTIPWAARGYRTIAVDLSGEMLSFARKKARSLGLQVSFLNQDLRSLKLGLPVDLAVCFQDGFNYLLSREELRRAFESVYENLNQGGLLIFDLNYLPRILASEREAGLVEDKGLSLSWKASFQEDEGLWEIEISGTVKGQAEGAGDFYEKHRERIHEPHEVWSLLTGLGFTARNSYQAFTFEQPHDRTARIVFVAQKV